MRNPADPSLRLPDAAPEELQQLVQQALGDKALLQGRAGAAVREVVRTESQSPQIPPVRGKADEESQLATDSLAGLGQVGVDDHAELPRPRNALSV